jgi:hypothetical protein
LAAVAAVFGVISSQSDLDWNGFNLIPRVLFNINSVDAAGGSAFNLLGMALA